MVLWSTIFSTILKRFLVALGVLGLMKRSSGDCDSVWGIWEMYADDIMKAMSAYYILFDMHHCTCSLEAITVLKK